MPLLKDHKLGSVHHSKPSSLSLLIYGVLFIAAGRCVGRGAKLCFLHQNIKNLMNSPAQSFSAFQYAKEAYQPSSLNQPFTKVCGQRQS